MAQTKENKKIVHEKGFQVKWFDGKTNVKLINYPILRPTDKLVILKWNDASKRDDWRMDGYLWVQQGGPKLCNFDGMPELGSKYYYHAFVERKTVITGKGDKSVVISTPKFKKTVWLNPAFPNTAFIEYEGDFGLAAEKPHGNAQYEPNGWCSQPFISTAPSVIKEARETKGKPGVTFRVMLNNAPRDLSRHPIEAIRDIEQVQNAKKNQDRKLRLSRDAIYNVIEIAHATNTVDFFSIHPNVVLIGHNEGNMEILNGLLDSKGPFVVLHVDITYNTGDFFCTIVSFVHPHFVDAPTIPAAFALTECKDMDPLEKFFKQMTLVAPRLSSATNFVVITDAETALVSSIQKCWPQAMLVRCWNHIFQNIRRKLQDLNIRKNVEKDKYVDQARSLFEEKDQLCYYKSYFEICRGWDQRFRDYFEKNIHCDIDRIGIWIAKNHGLSDFTNNRAESINKNLKAFNEWKECQLDVMLLALHRFMESYNADLIRSLYGRGSYLIKDKFASLYHSESCPDLPEATNPETVIQDVFNSRMVPNKEETFPPKSPKSDSYELDMTQLCDRERALFLLKNGKVKPNTDRLGTWIVEDEVETRVTRLLPSPHCTCPALPSCYHILALQLTFGAHSSHLYKRNANITAFRKRALARNMKIYGRKSKKRATKKLYNLKTIDPDVSKENNKETETPSFIGTSDGQKEVDEDWLAGEFQEASCTFPFQTTQYSVPKQSDDKDFDTSSMKSGVAEKEIFKPPQSPIPSLAGNESHIREEIETFKNRNEEIGLSETAHSVSPFHTLFDEPYLNTEQDSTDLFIIQPELSPLRVSSTLNAKNRLNRLNQDEVATVTSCSNVSLKISLSLDDISINNSSSASTTLLDRDVSKEKQIGMKIVNAKVELEASFEGRVIEQFGPRTPFDWTSQRLDVRDDNWLSNDVMNAVSTLLRAEKPELRSFFNVEFGISGNFPRVESSKFIQFVHNGSDHWILATRNFFSSVKNDAIIVHILDSGSLRLTGVLRAAIASLLRTEDKKFEICYLPVQKQLNSYDCGVFAIAFATSLVFGENPLLIDYDANLMRSHLKECLEKRRMAPFPSSQRRSLRCAVSLQKTVNVFCICRRPHRFLNIDKRIPKSCYDDDMAQCGGCNRWFHRECVSIPDNVFPSKTINWSCSIVCKALAVDKKGKSKLSAKRKQTEVAASTKKAKKQ